MAAVVRSACVAGAGLDLKIVNTQCVHMNSIFFMLVSMYVVGSLFCVVA